MLTTLYSIRKEIQILRQKLEFLANHSHENDSELEDSKYDEIYYSIAVILSDFNELQRKINKQIREEEREKEEGG